MARPRQVQVDVPREESVRFGRVGLIALGGFIIGIVWPRVAGLELVPSAPVRHKSTASTQVSASAASSEGKPGADKKPSAKPTAETTAPPAPEKLAVDEAVITSCRDREGKSRNDCSLDLDGVARARLLALSECEAVKGRKGTMSIGFDVDFAANKLGGFTSGKSTTLPSDVAQGLIACAQEEFASASLSGIEHEHTSYTVFYKLDFLPDPKAGTEEEEGGEGTGDASQVVEASGRATVSWHTALIRAEPPKGRVIARILSGTEVVITGRAGDWYRVKYRGREGWVFRSAIGL